MWLVALQSLLTLKKDTRLLISIKTLYVLWGKITTLVLGFWGVGGVGINFHRVSCYGFEIMNTRANDKILFQIIQSEMQRKRS